MIAMRTLLLIVPLLAASCAFEPAGAAADAPGAESTFDAWRYRAPSGWTIKAGGDHVGFEKINGKDFCQIALYKPRVAGADIESEMAEEWKLTVEEPLETSAVKSLGRRTTGRGLSVRSTAATVSAGEGTYYLVLHVVTPPGQISSVVVTANDAARMGRCEAAGAAFLESLSTASMTTAMPSSAKLPATAPVRAAIVGRWAQSASDGHLGVVTSGSVKRQYEFNADGTYRFHSESWGGTFRSTEWYVVDESGTFSVEANRVTVVPASAKGVLRTKQEVLKTMTLPLERVTYTWQTTYFEGIQETNLVLTPPAKTTRDGVFAANDRFKSSYLYSAQYTPEWTF